MASVRLICAPYAGAGASVFQGLAAHLPETIEPYAMQPPGREERYDAPAFEDWTNLVAAALEAIAALPQTPVALMGHSFGAVVAFELARAMETANTSPVAHLFCAAMPWPGAWGARAAISNLDDDALVKAMEKRFGTSPPSFQNPEIRSLALPGLRADLQLLETYAWRSHQPLGCPLTVIGGAEDPATRDEDLTQWRDETAGPFTVAMLKAEHYFLDTHQEQLAKIIADGIKT